MNKLDYKNMGELKEYIGYKIEQKVDWIKLTQPVLVQSLEDEFTIPLNTLCNLLEPSNKELVSEDKPLSEGKKKIYKYGVEKLLFLIQYS